MLLGTSGMRIHKNCSKSCWCVPFCSNSTDFMWDDEMKSEKGNKYALSVSRLFDQNGTIDDWRSSFYWIVTADIKWPQ